MKAKIIRAFLAIYLALSLAYGGLRAAYLTVSAALAPPDRAENQIELAAPATFGIDTVPAEPELPEVVTLSPTLPPTAAPTSSPAPVPEETAEPQAAPSPAEEPEDEPASVWEPEEEALPEAPAEAEDQEEAYAEVPAETEDQEEALLEAPAETEDQEEAYVEAAPAQDVPSLEDSLSGLHFGRCGRNCFLSNPRCRTGNRKAQSAAEEYYAIYGAEADV